MNLRDDRRLSRVEGAVSNLGSDTTTYPLYQTRSSNLGRGIKSSANMRVNGIIPMSNERIKALEIAYLTKLMPGARPAKST